MKINRLKKTYLFVFQKPLGSFWALEVIFQVFLQVRVVFELYFVVTFQIFLQVKVVFELYLVVIFKIVNGSETSLWPGLYVVGRSVGSSVGNNFLRGEKLYFHASIGALVKVMLIATIIWIKLWFMIFKNIRYPKFILRTSV